MRIPIAFLLLFLLIAGCGRRIDPGLDSIYEGYLRDRASILAPAERQMLEKQLGLLERETGVDLRVVTTELGAAPDCTW